MTSSERAHLARILGMLGSEHAGERAAAGLQAEAFRKRHGLTWEAMLSVPAVEAERATPPRPPESPQTAPTPHPPPSRPRTTARPVSRLWSDNAPEQMKAAVLVVAWISLPVLLTFFL